jgi:hypothetical protein
MGLIIEKGGRETIANNCLSVRRFRPAVQTSGSDSQTEMRSDTPTLIAHSDYYYTVYSANGRRRGVVLAKNRIETERDWLFRMAFISREGI